MIRVVDMNKRRESTTKWKTTFIGLGSNLGDRLDNLRQAVRHLEGESVVVTAWSSLYETEPVGFKDQPYFLNAVICVSTTLGPIELLKRSKDIESDMGRQSDFRNAPRPIDIDLLLYGQVVLDTPNLVIPHPRLAERAFVLVPLAELAAQWIHPVLNRTIQELQNSVDGRDGVQLYLA